MGEVVTINRLSEANNVIDGSNDDGTPPLPPGEVGVRDGDGDDYVEGGIKQFEELLEDEAQIAQAPDEGSDGDHESGRIFEMRPTRSPAMPALGRAATVGLIGFKGREHDAVMPVDRQKELGEMAINDAFELIYGGRRARKARPGGMPPIRR